MKRTKDRPKATLDRPSDTTGRDGAIDFIAKVESSVVLNQRDDDRFTRIMGSAVIDLWSLCGGGRRWRPRWPRGRRLRWLRRQHEATHSGRRESWPSYIPGRPAVSQWPS
jgi:hypothetical protein